ncbi:hypothetical protein ACQP1P_28450 [Dactylosporangium sp. CA-052675]|uniref:hypothetical protein n=1 Tax=Dactylosporangium sp. CA-052675 TaxID=3239927 RepID=UPI003D8F5F78
MKFRQIVDGIATTLTAAGFEEVRPHPSYAAATHVVFVRAEADELLSVAFEPMRNPPGRHDFTVRLRAATANWLRFAALERPDAPAEAHANLWEHAVGVLPGFEGIGHEIWAVVEGDDVVPLQTALSRELATRALPGMRAELRHLHAIEDAVRRGDDVTAQRLVNAPRSRNLWHGAGPEIRGFIAWLRQGR